MASDSIHLPSGLLDHAGHQFPWDIVVLAVLAGVLGVCLYQILGRRVGAQAVRQEPGRQMRRAGVSSGPDVQTTPPPLPGAAPAEVAFSVTEREIPAPATRVGDVLGRIAARVDGFTPDKFLDQAESMFRRIVPAFAVGDRAALAGLLTEQTETAFAEAITARNDAGETQRSDLRGIERLSILDAAIRNPEDAGEVAVIEVSIVSRQVNLLTNRSGDPVLGTDAVTEFHDLWLFERPLASTNGSATWRLAASRPA